MSKIWRAILVREDQLFAKSHGVVEVIADDENGAAAIISRRCSGRIVDVFQKGEMRDGIEYEIDAETSEMRKMDVGNGGCDAEELRESAGAIDYDASVGSNSNGETNNAKSQTITGRRGEEAFFRISVQKLAEMRKSACETKGPADSGFRRRATD